MIEKHKSIFAAQNKKTVIYREGQKLLKNIRF